MSKPQPAKWRYPLLISSVIAFGPCWPVAPVQNLVTEQGDFAYRLFLPWAHILWTPFTSVADYLTALSFKELLLFVSAVIFFSFFVFRIRRALVSMSLFVLFIAWAVLCPRPMARLIAPNASTLLIDFHSHSQTSHDGRPGFSAEKNMAWHQEQGFGAAFITDHNKTESTVLAKNISRQNWRQTGFRSLEGEEVSLYRTHLVVLGNHERIDNRPYDSHPARWPIFIRDMKAKGYVVIASLPEYWWYHWPRGVEAFVKWGISGFEIANSAPKALDFPVKMRRQIIDLCRRQNLPVMGISDSHGYGQATAVWSSMVIPGWSMMDPDTLERSVLRRLKEGGFQSVSVLARTKWFPSNTLEWLVSPLANVWIYWRSLQPLQAVSWIAWIWITFFIGYNHAWHFLISSGASRPQKHRP